MEVGLPCELLTLLSVYTVVCSLTYIVIWIIWVIWVSSKLTMALFWTRDNKKLFTNNNMTQQKNSSWDVGRLPPSSSSLCFAVTQLAATTSARHWRCNRKILTGRDDRSNEKRKSDCITLKVSPCSQLSGLSDHLHIHPEQDFHWTATITITKIYKSNCLTWCSRWGSASLAAPSRLGCEPCALDLRTTPGHRMC